MSRNTRLPNYYKILKISENATIQQIRTAYKRAALETHPDRVPSDSPERDERKRRFQLVNDAYYTLSDDKRKMEYDAKRGLYGQTGSDGQTRASNDGMNPDAGTDFDDRFDEGEAPSGGAQASGNEFFSWAWETFMKNANGDRQQTEDRQWENAFEEMYDEEMNDEGNAKKSSFWSAVGGVAGGALGYIGGNIPGMIAGGVAGNRFGAIRDAKGKSVYEVYQGLAPDARMALLTQLAMRVFSHAAGV